MQFNMNVSITWWTDDDQKNAPKQEHIEALKESGMERASSMMAEGYNSGELLDNIHMVDDDPEDGIAYRGWWSVTEGEGESSSAAPSSSDSDEGTTRLKEEGWSPDVEDENGPAAPAWFGVFGRIPSHLKDTCLVFQAESQSEAVMMFTDALYEDSEEGHRDDIWEKYRTHIYITTVVKSQSPITINNFGSVA